MGGLNVPNAHISGGKKWRVFLPMPLLDVIVNDNCVCAANSFAD